MNILYIIGNGLDIAHHMKTSYQDFFKHYLALSSTDEDVLNMKNDIDKHRYETWADLEIGLGAYSSQCANKDVFLKCLRDIKGNLKDYLQKESEKIGAYRISSYNSFLNPGSFLDPEPRSRYEEYRDRRGTHVVIDVITLNYTSTIEYLLDYKNKPTPITNSAQLRFIQHVHGTLESMMVMGVNDIGQIANGGFHTDMDIVEDFVKPEYNDACMNNKNAICGDIIEEADIIVLYGTSIGLSDKKWWKIIGKRMDLPNYPLLVYFPHDVEKDQSVAPNHLRRWTMGYVKEIKDKFEIQLDDDSLASRMCVAINKQLFPLSIVKSHPQMAK